MVHVVGDLISTDGFLLQISTCSVSIWGKNCLPVRKRHEMLRIIQRTGAGLGREGLRVYVGVGGRVKKSFEHECYQCQRIQSSVTTNTGQNMACFRPTG